MRKVRLSAKFRRLLATSLITLGSLFLANAIWPIISYYFFVLPQLKQNYFLSPVPEDQITKTLPPTLADLSTPQIIGSSRDYTKLDNWFNDSSFSPPPHQSKITHYTLSIPKLKIKDAVVEIGGNDLLQNLIQYPGTANPGEYGATVIFGHSILRQFYNPGSYRSIFSTIMTLEKGDDIFVNFDGIRYRFQVSQKQIVEPQDLTVLRQEYNLRGLKLVTCVPEGTYIYRGFILAQLVSYL